ncbi:MAG: hypothetical protein V1928_00890 [Parcubacteria group bacterium]
MRKWYKKFKKSQNLIECLIALGLFFFFSVSFATLAVQYTNSIAKATSLDAIKSTARENLEALQNMSYENFNLLADGNYDLNPSGNSWQLSASTNEYNCMFRCRQGKGAGKAVGFYKCKNMSNNPNKDCDIIMQYQKFVNIQAVTRNNKCELATGGTIDPDTKFVTITFNWLQNDQIFTKNFSQYFTNWRQPTACLKAGYLSNVVYSGDNANFSGSTGAITGNITVANNFNAGSMSVNGTVTQNGTVDMPTVDFDSYKAIADHVINNNYSFAAGNTYEGIWYVKGDATLNSNITFNGTLVATRHITLENKNSITITPTGAYPALLAGDDIHANHLSSSTINGLMFAVHDFEIEYGTNLTINGSLMTGHNMNAKNSSGFNITYDQDLKTTPPPYFSN